MLNIGWVDFSKSDRDMVMSVLRQLEEPGAMDELGIGTIRDAFSDILFPGTSTIQTRAKYLFLIPYLCMELEREGILSPSNFIESMEKRELALIDILARDNAEGIIGSRSGQALKRKPSIIYWNALRMYGFFTEPLTLSEYASILFRVRSSADNQKRNGKSERCHEDDTVDDSDTGMTGVNFWRIPSFSRTWRDGLSINLTKEEAAYLRGKILSMPNTQESLLALILHEKRFDFTSFENFTDLDGLQNLMPEKLRRDYCLARDFSRFIFGAQIRYNVIFSEGKNEKANMLWSEYLNEHPTVNLSAIQERLRPRAGVMRFLRRFQSAIEDTNELDSVIIQRERELKGPSRAKLVNKELYQYNDNSVNMERLTYRLGNVQRLIRDVFEGEADYA